MTSVRSRADVVNYPIFDKATRDDILELKEQVHKLSTMSQVIVNRLLHMPPLIRLRRNIISAIDRWIERPYTTIVPDGLDVYEAGVLKEAPALSTRAQVALHALYNLHDRQEFIGRMLPVLNKYRSANE